MTTQEVKRKLAAILSADVEGYSRLMGENEVHTIRTLTAYKEAMTVSIKKHRKEKGSSLRLTFLDRFANEST